MAVPPPSLSAQDLAFADTVGLHFETLGFPRIGGRMLGLLLIAPRPLAADELALALQVSKASVSTNTHVFSQLGVLEARSLPGDRRRFFTIREGMWESRIPFVLAHVAGMRRMASLGLDQVGDARPDARARLEKMYAFADFMGQQLDGILARWQEAKA